MYKEKKRRNRRGFSSKMNGNGNSNRNRNRRNTKEKKPRDYSQYINKVAEESHVETYKSTNSFKDFELDSALLKQLDQLGYKTPSEIQDKSIPIAMSGVDVIGIAGTGTGKTAAFLLPIVQNLIEEPRYSRALIVTPTRELASQIFDEFFKLTKGLDLKASTLIGGVNIGRSIKDLNRRNDIIIGTPGRLMDMAKRGHLKLDQFSTLVLDEFDRMLDMGFLKEVERLNDQMICKEQTLLFSATRDKSQAAAIERMTHEATEVRAKVATQFTAAIEQDVVYVPKDSKKLDFLTRLIEAEGKQKVILFCETKRMVQKAFKNLKEAGITTDTIDGDKTQRARESALRKFKNGKIDVIVATDVLSRGIDVKGVNLVINYEPPREYSDYVHRIGRTGRAGQKGRALTLIG